MTRKHTVSVQLFAHRGASGLAPENTKVGLAKALEYDIDGIETDCRITKDNIVVLHHNADLVDASGSTLRLQDYTFDELLLHKPDLLSLHEALATIHSSTQMMLEIKEVEAVRPTIQLVRAALLNGWDVSRFTYASFDDRVLKIVHDEMPEVDRIVLEVWCSTRAVYRARKFETKKLSMDQGFMWWFFVKQMAKNYQLYSYPAIRKPLRLNHTRPSKWIKHGLYGIITNHPDLYADKNHLYTEKNANHA